MLPDNTVTDKPLPIGEVYTGVIATPDMVGRREILTQVDEAINDASQSYIINIVGDGGIGKTRLARHILKKYGPNEALLVASELIDLYHPTTHIIGDLVHVIQQIVAPDGAGFENYQRQRKKLLEYAIKPPEKAEELRQQRNKTIDTFLQELVALTANRRLVLVFDTTEKLSYQEDPTARHFGAGQDQPDILDWMCKTFLPGLTNAVVIMAGRPGSGELSQLLNNIQGKQTLNILLEGLNEEESLKYFEAVIASAAATGNPKDAEAANVLSLWTEDQRRVIFYSLHDGGKQPRIRPILLALAIDHLMVAGQPLPQLTYSLAEAKNRSPAERISIQHELGRVLVQALREDARRSDEIVVTLGWLQKGADAALLSKITRLSIETVEAALEEIKGLSFVKIRPADKRIFLHDEMYAILMEYGQRMISGPQRQHLYDILQEHYEELIESLRDRIARLYRPKAQKPGLPSAEQVVAAQALLQEAMVEDLHYRLRWNAQKGFDTYFRYAEEAVSGDDDDLGVLLRTELLTFLAEYDPTGQQEEVAGLKRSVIVADAAVRAAEWLWNDDKYKEALALLEKNESIIAAGDALVQAEALSWKGYLLGYEGKYQQAEELLNKAIDMVEQQSEKTYVIRQVAIQARAYNNQGYVFRLQGKIYEAIEAYQKAIALWRVAGMKAEQAQTLNNRAFALAEIGSFQTARQQGEDALELRQELGPNTPVAMSLGTLARIEMFDNNLGTAQRYAEQALELYNISPSPRRRGLTLRTLAEIKRLFPRLKTYELTVSAQFFAEALALAQEAEEIFRYKISEPARLSEVLFELGRIYRDWAVLRRDFPDILADSEKETQANIYPFNKLVQKSEAAFTEAVDLAGTRGDLNEQVDGLLKLAWLYFQIYLTPDTSDFDQTFQDLDENVLCRIESLIPLDYHAKECTSADVTEEDSGTQLPKHSKMLIFLGRLQLIRGNIMFNKWKIHRSVDDLQQATERFTVALYYFELYSDHPFRDKREAIEYIYDNFKRLSARNILIVYETVEKTEQKYGIQNSRMSHFLKGRFGDPDKYESGLTKTVNR